MEQTKSVARSFKQTPLTSELSQLVDDLPALRHSARKRLQQFHLENLYSPDELINMATEKLLDKLREEEKVHCVQGWMRNTIFNVVRNLKRKHEGCDLYEPGILEETLDGDTLSETNRSTYLADESELIQKALSQLSAENQELLKLRFFQDLSWEEIAMHYEARGKSIKVATLRQRGKRAIDALRGQYNKIISE